MEILIYIRIDMYKEALNILWSMGMSFCERGSILYIFQFTLIHVFFKSFALQISKKRWIHMNSDIAAFHVSSRLPSGIKQRVLQSCTEINDIVHKHLSGNNRLRNFTSS